MKNKGAGPLFLGEGKNAAQAFARDDNSVRRINERGDSPCAWRISLCVENAGDGRARTSVSTSRNVEACRERQARRIVGRPSRVINHSIDASTLRG